MVMIAFWVFFQGKFESWGDVIKTFGPSVFFWGLIILITR